MDNKALVALIRKKLADEEEITPTQFVMEGISAGVTAVQFHVRCFYL